MQTDERAHAGGLQRRGEFSRHLIDPVAQPVAQRVEADSLRWREDLGKAGEAAGHGQHVVVERSRMRQ